jgi:DNA-binding MarR family transcriptional regulator
MPDQPDMSVDPERPPRSVGFLISQLGFVSSRGFFEALRPLGIDPRQWTLLRHVAQEQGQSQQALAERLGLPASAMVPMVDTMEESGLLERRPSPSDRRVRALYVTAKGRRTLKRAVDVAIAYERDLCSGLEPREREQLIDLLQKLQADKVARRGVHPGIARPHPAEADDAER